MDYDDFIELVADRADVMADEAAVLTLGTLQTLAERLSGGEAADLAAQLPKPLQTPLRKDEEEAEPFGLAEFVRRVADRSGFDDVLAMDGVRAVLSTLRDAVSGGEFDDVLSQLPKEFWDLVASTA
jgi:uncharacterized protein (DUF2267 family)